MSVLIESPVEIKVFLHSKGQSNIPRELSISALFVSQHKIQVSVEKTIDISQTKKPCYNPEDHKGEPMETMITSCSIKRLLKSSTAQLHLFPQNTGMAQKSAQMKKDQVFTSFLSPPLQASPPTCGQMTTIPSLLVSTTLTQCRKLKLKVNICKSEAEHLSNGQVALQAAHIKNNRNKTPTYIDQLN